MNRRDLRSWTRVSQTRAAGRARPRGSSRANLSYLYTPPGLPATDKIVPEREDQRNKGLHSGPTAVPRRWPLSVRLLGR